MGTFTEVGGKCTPKSFTAISYTVYKRVGGGCSVALQGAAWLKGGYSVAQLAVCWPAVW